MKQTKVYQEIDRPGDRHEARIVELNRPYKIRHYTGFIREIVFVKFYKNGNISAKIDGLFLEKYEPNDRGKIIFDFVN